MRSVFSEKPCDNCNADRQIGNPYNWQRECDRCTKIGQWRNEVLKRLAEIENILGDEYDLDRLKELTQADKEDRCLVLPCKVGDTVFTYCYLRNSGTLELSEYKIYGIEIDDKTITYKATKWKPVGNGVLSQKVEWWFDIKDIGKDVFFTKEERKKALEGLE